MNFFKFVTFKTFFIYSILHVIFSLSSQVNIGKLIPYEKKKIKVKVKLEYFLR